MAGPALSWPYVWDQITHYYHNQGQLYCASWGMCRAASLKYLSWLVGRASSPDLTPRPSSPMMSRWHVRSVLHSPQTSTRSQVAFQASDVHMDFCGNRLLLLQDLRPRCGSGWQHRSQLYYGSRWHQGLLISVCSSRLSSLQFWLFNSTQICLFIFLFHFSASYLLLLVVSGVSGVVSGVVSRVLCILAP